MSYLKIILRSGLYSAIGGVIANLIAYANRIYLVKNLSPEEFGLFYAVFTFMLFFMLFRDLGLNKSVSRFIAEFNVQKQFGKIKSALVFMLSVQILTSTILVLLFMLTSNFLGKFYFKSELAAPLIMYFSLYFVLSILFKFLPTFFSGFQNIRVLPFIQPVKNLVIFILCVVFINQGLDIYSPTFAYILVGPILLLIFLIPLFRTFNPFKHKIDDFKGVSKRVTNFSMPLIIEGAENKFISYFDVLMLTYFSTLTIVGVYNIILPTAILFMFIADALTSIFMPVITELWVKGDKKRIELGMNLLYKYLFIFSVPLILAFFVFSDLFIKTVFGNDYLMGNIAFKILLIGILFNMIAVINRECLVGLGKSNLFFKVVFFGMIFNVGLNIILIPLFGINGAAFSTSFSYIIMMFLSIFYIKKYVDIKIPVKSWSVIFISGITFIFLITFFKNIFTFNIWFEAILALVIGFIFYFGVLISVHILYIPELLSYIKKIK